MGEFSAASSCQRIVQEHPSSLGPRGTAWSLLCGCRISLFMYKETEGAGCWWLVRWLIFLLRKLYPLFFFIPLVASVKMLIIISIVIATNSLRIGMHVTSKCVIAS